MSKIFTVFGVTGQQGGALIKYLLDHPVFSKEYTFRAVTRDATKPAAVALRKKGVEIVEADMNKPETLVEAMTGTHTVFALTNWVESMDPAVEVVQGKALADAAVKAGGVKLYIWSSLPRTGMAHFDSKAEVEEYIRRTFPAMTTTTRSFFFMPGWFMQNFVRIMKPKKRVGVDGETEYVLAQPFPGATLDTALPLIDIEDTGKFIAPFLSDPEKYAGKQFFACTGNYTIREICQTWTTATGTKIVYDEQVDAIAESDMGEAVKESLKNRDRSQGYYGPEGDEGIDWTLAQIQEKLTTWEEFVKRNEPWF
ncbi:uncharacterized protein PV06_06104 [Exophiala oligosperma]|uniref:NmrA-like domain-containing protein n=1 Tax=Exophiala oligosperma TaxID=215243 RepID=A0A0D2DJF9_9EURO|nr:uncharacterized protein PV06_06104 [Exophiala oligosperma]KIW42565.1 hypothetical protein PV06_06104 [Exophiala oligosperma]